jgi:hypothetical protein
MMVRMLALLAVLGMALAPFVPAQRVYLCAMDHQLHASSCCQADGRCGARHDGSGCCKLLVIRQFMAPGHGQAAVPTAAAPAPGSDLPAAPVVLVLGWVRRTAGFVAKPAPPPPPDPLFVRHCCWLT